MRQRRLVTSLAALALVATACGDSASDESAVDDALVDPPALATEPLPELDLASLEAETAAGTLDAVPASGTTYTGAVTEDLYIGISLMEDPDGGGGQEAFVYLCDGQVDAYLRGEIGTEPTTLERDGVTVEVALDGDAMEGTVTFEGEEPEAFRAEPASGPAGLYAAAFSFDGTEYLPMWIALADGSQRGQASWQCCSAEGCYVCEWSTADTAGPTADPQPVAHESDPWWTRWFGIGLETEEELVEEDTERN